MIVRVSDIMVRDFVTVDALEGVRHIYNLFLESAQNCCPVIENNKIIGVLTYKELAMTHPNRIAADAMSKKFVTVRPDITVWRAKEIFQEQCIDALFVIENKQLVGLVTKPLLDAELGKHIDLLTGLYKTDYIYYNATKLVEGGHKISLIFFDLNNFGRIDKKYGHINGDIILREVATILKSNLAEQIYLARFGGDEFLMVTSLPINQCIDSAKQLIYKIANHKFHNSIPLSVAVGIAEGNIRNKDMQGVLLNVSKLINLASLASTRAKNDKCELYVADAVDTCDIA